MATDRDHMAVELQSMDPQDQKSDATIEGNSDLLSQTSSPSSVNASQDALLPTDEGFHAWKALAGAFTANMMVWGFAFSFGVLQEYYASHQPFAERGGPVAAIGTTTTGIMYLTMPLFLSAFQRWPKARRWSMWFSVPAIPASLVGASFATTVTELIVLQGVFFAIAGNSLVMPSMALVNEWFSRKRGLALGIAIAGDFVGGVAMPLLLQLALAHIGFRWTLRIVAATMVLFTLPFVVLYKPRLPIPRVYIAPPIDTSFLRSRFFWILQLFSVSQSLGYFLPTNYLPTIAESLGTNKTLGSLTVLCVNLSATVGCIVVGALADHFEVTTVLLGLSVLACAAIFTLLGVSTSLPPLYAFGLLYGLTAAPYSTGCWGGTIRELQKMNANTDANIVFGLLAFGRGVGSLVSGPLSGALIEKVKASPIPQAVYYGQYGPIVIFAGCTAFSGGLGWFVRYTGFI